MPERRWPRPITRRITRGPGLESSRRALTADEDASLPLSITRSVRPVDVILVTCFTIASICERTKAPWY